MMPSIGLLVLRPPISSLLQSATAFFYYKVRQVLLQNATGITKCNNFIAKCDRYYKVQRLLQSATEQPRALGGPAQRDDRYKLSAKKR